MNGKEIIADWLKTNGYDGLCLPSEGCGCLISELMPCGSSPHKCVPGHKSLRDDGDWEVVEGL